MRLDGALSWVARQPRTEAYDLLLDGIKQFLFEFPLSARFNLCIFSVICRLFSLNRALPAARKTPEPTPQASSAATTPRAYRQSGAQHLYALNQ